METPNSQHRSSKACQNYLLAMEEESVISVTSTNMTGDGADSRSNIVHPQNRVVYDHENLILTPSKFKGVISQANGHWGAQIYLNHQRIWLGTFKTDKEAAMAYDSAALKLRSGESYRNVPWTNMTIHEPTFQSQFSTEAILNMLKDGSYLTKFGDFLRLQYQEGQIVPKARSNTEAMGKQLFRKELTPSDVGKLNRLVIPKKFAVKYFPQIRELEQQNEGVQDSDLVFLDRSKRSWKFRYCYWKSSQSYVFTRGWNRFVKEKGLRSKDVIIFSRLNEIQNVCTIDVQYNDPVEDANLVKENLLLEMRLSYPDQKQGIDTISPKANEQEVYKGVEEQEKMCVVPQQKNDTQHKGFRLFGVQIA